MLESSQCDSEVSTEAGKDHTVPPIAILVFGAIPPEQGGQQLLLEKVIARLGRNVLAA